MPHLHFLAFTPHALLRRLAESLVAASLLLGLSLGSVSPDSGAGATTAPTAAEQVQAYYARLDARDFPGAWALLSPAAQARLSYADWVAGFATTVAIRTPSVAVTARSPQQEIVALRVVALDQSARGVVERSYGGTWVVMATAEGWRLDQADLQRLT